MIGYLYIIKNLQNGHFYLGSTLKEPNDRKSEHFSALNGNYHFNTHLQNAWNLYGKDNFTFEPIEEIEILLNDKSEASLFIREIETKKITLLNPHYNICRETRGGKLGRIPTKEERENLRIKNTGKKHTIEAIKKIKEARAKQVITEEHKIKVSIKMKGRVSPWLNKKFSEEHKKRIGKSVKSSVRKRVEKSFICFKDGKMVGEFSFKIDAANNLNLRASSIRTILSRGKGTYKGYSFIYK